MWEKSWSLWWVLQTVKSSTSHWTSEKTTPVKRVPVYQNELFWKGYYVTFYSTSTEAAKLQLLC